MDSPNLKSHLNSISIKQIKTLIRQYNLHYKIKLSQNKPDLISDLLKHFETDTIDNKMISTKLRKIKRDMNEKKNSQNEILFINKQKLELIKLSNLIKNSSLNENGKKYLDENSKDIKFYVRDPRKSSIKKKVNPHELILFIIKNVAMNNKALASYNEIPKLYKIVSRILKKTSQDLKKLNNEKGLSTMNFMKLVKNIIKKLIILFNVKKKNVNYTENSLLFL